MTAAEGCTAANRAGDARSWETYARAERFLPWNVEKLVFGAQVEPHWIDGGERFWYRVSTGSGHQFVVVDAARGAREPAFDHIKLAAALSRASGTPYVHHQPPFESFAYANDGAAIEFAVEDECWSCTIDSGRCERRAGRADRSANGATSPDGRWIATAEEHNLIIRPLGGGDALLLTDDGIADHDYATPLRSPLKAAGIKEPDEPPPLPGIWSPDSAKLLSYRIDRRDVGLFHLVQSVPLNGERRPVLHSYAYPLPGDANVPTAELFVFDVKARSRQRVQREPLPLLYYGSPLLGEFMWWSEDSDRVYLLTSKRGYCGYELAVVDSGTGDVRTLLGEEAATGIEPYLAWSGRPLVRVFDGGDRILWFSQRDGWGHLYLYDGASGDLIRQLTAGAWAVSDILHVDETERWVYFTGVGREPERDPYYDLVYRVPIDGGEAELLTPEDATHRAIFAPHGRSFVDTYSRVDLPPITVLRRGDGSLIAELERADIGPLLATGWSFPERFRVKARDGETDIFGVMLRPSGLTPNAAPKLPVVDDIYTGPQRTHAPTSFGAMSGSRPWPNRGFWRAQAVAELGFAVVMIDGLGMPRRSKAFHDRSYRNLGDGGIEDHVVAIRQLGERYSDIDASSVGIYGHSAGGYASTRAMLTFPDVFKVGVSSAGNHDHRLDKAIWVERYMGLPVGDHYADQANSTHATKLKGKLLLVHGEMDENVHVASTLRLVDALIAANKDFDLLILPNRPHGCADDPYFIRRVWDHFVRHLLNREPPVGYKIRPPPAGTT